MSKVQIKSRYDSHVVVYECEAPEGTQNAMRFALEKVAKEREEAGIWPNTSAMQKAVSWPP